MQWETVYNERKAAIAQRSDCGRYQIAMYASAPRYCLFARDASGARFEVVACSDDVAKLKQLADERQCNSEQDQQECENDQQEVYE